MKVTTADAKFRPITITIENQDDLDQLIAIVEGVAHGSINFAPQVREAAQAFVDALDKGNKN